jgi:rhodanese-related sulfurtransferase
MMSKRYIILAIILLGAAFLLIILPSKQKSNQIDPSLLLLEINDPARYLDADHVAERIIELDPSLFLIDVRSIYDFEEYAIPGAVNIPLEEIMDKQWADYLAQDSKDIVFYSNSDIYADQAWVLSKEKGYKNLYVLKGGLNDWFKTIMLPIEPEEGAPSEAFDLYSFRKGASFYFGGSVPEIPVAVESISVENTPDPAAKKKVEVVKKVKKAAEGGC